MRIGREWISSPRRLGALLVALSMLLATAAAGQEDEVSPDDPELDDPWAGVEQMVIVGKGFAGTLTDASISVTSFDAGDLEAFGVGDVSDVAAFTPNLEIRTAGSTSATFFIRGVGLNDFTANAASAVAVYVDDAPRNLPAIQLGLLYDLEGIEVLKGPQGSGPGRNASAGAIRIFNKKPTGDFSAYGRFDYGNYNRMDVEGALEYPILEDVLAMRSAFRLKLRDGLFENRCGDKLPSEVVRPEVCGNQVTGRIAAGLEKDLNDIDQWATRTAFRYVPPVAGMEWTFTGHADRTDQFATVGEHLGTRGFLGAKDAGQYRAPEVDAEQAEIQAGLNIPTRRACRQSPDPPACLQRRQDLVDYSAFLLSKNLAERPLDKAQFKGDYNNPGYERQTSYGFLLHGDWDLDGVLIDNIMGFERYDRERLIDADFSPNELFEFQIDDDAWQVTHDLRFSGELEETPLSWRSGTFYLQEELDYAQATLSEDGPVEPVFQDYRQRTWGFGVFAEMAWDLLDDFTFEAGARYNWERKRFEAEIFRGRPARNQCGVLPTTGAIPPCQRTETTDHPTGMVGFKYRYDELRTFYVKFSHGWKGAQFNARDGVRANEVTDVASPEKIDAFELGMNGSWLDDRIKADGAVFWYDYENYQVFTFTNDTGVPPTRVVINADDAQLYGAELELTLEPLEQLIIEFRGSWLESKFLDFTESVVRPVPDSNEFFRQVFDFNGNPLPNAPRFKVSVSASYTLDVGRFGSITPRYDLAWTDDVAFDPSDGTGSPSTSGDIFLPRNTIGQDAFTLHNIRLTYVNPTGNLEFSGWVRNMLNEVYKTQAFDASGGPALVGNLLGDPRTYGLSLKLTY